MEEFARAVHVAVHLLDELLHGLEGDHAAQPVDERDLHLDAVQLQVCLLYTSDAADE